MTTQWHAKRGYDGTTAERGALGLGADGRGILFYDTDESVWYRWDGTQWEAHALIADGVTRTVGVSGDHTTVQGAVDWFADQRVLFGACVIDVDAGTYDEAVTFEDIVLAAGATLELEGDTRVLAGLSYVDGASCNGAGLANGGSGACTLANAGAVITVTGAVTNPDFDADGWGSGDNLLVFDNTGTITEYTISSTLNNTITLTVAAPNVGNDGTAICLLPDRRIERTSAGICVNVDTARGIEIDGFYLEPHTGASCHGIFVRNGGSITCYNVAAYAEDQGFQTSGKYSALNAATGAISAWGCNRGYFANQASQIIADYAVAVECTTGMQSQTFSLVVITSSATADCDTGYYALTFSFLNAASTSANARANTVDYNPAASATHGNTGAMILWS